MKKITLKGSSPINLNRQLRQAINSTVDKSVENVKRNHITYKSANKDTKKR